MLGIAPGCGDGLAIRHPIPQDTALWVIADDVVGSDGSSVSSWPGHNGNPTFTQATGANQPIIKRALSTFNGHSAVRFDGSNDYLGSAAVSTSGKNMTVIYVCRRADDAREADVVFSPNANWNSGPPFGIFFYGADTVGVGQGTGITFTGIGMGRNVGASHLRTDTITYLKDATGWTITSTSPGFVTLTPADTDDIVLTGPRIGWNPDTVYTSFPGDIAEVIVWTRKLTATEAANVRANMVAKYGIT